MSTLQAFFEQFWTVFLGATAGVAILWSMQRGRPPFLALKSLPELAGRTEDEQLCLVREATTQAFRSWRALLVVLPFPLAMAVGVGLGHALPTVSSLPNSIWLHAGLAAVFGGFGVGSPPGSSHDAWGRS